MPEHSKINIRSIYLCAFLCWCTVGLHAQDKIKLGDERISVGEYSLALPYYLSADSMRPGNADLNTKIGVCYLNSNYCKSKCMVYFRRAYGLNRKISKRMPYFLGRGYHLNYQWDSAISEYQEYLKAADAKEKKEVNKYIEECNSGKELMQHPAKTKLVNLGLKINSPYKDYAPFLTADENEIIFTSRRPGPNSSFIGQENGEYIEKIYVAHFKDGAWADAEDIGGPINTEDNNATAYITPDGQKLFLYRDINNGDIYVSNYTAQGWTEPEPLSDKINTNYSESSICLSPDGKILYFVSDRPGGKGGKDIYKSLLQADNTWGDAINLGDTINTPYDEEGIFIHPDGRTMFFSSKGHNTMGGYDVFRSDYMNGTWGIPQNLGYPINSPDDDVFFTVSANGQHGYYASARDSIGYGALDIYRVDMTNYNPKLIVIKGVIGDSVTRQPLMANIKLTSKTGNINNTSVANSEGEYVLSLPSGNDYEVAIQADGYASCSFKVSVDSNTAYYELAKNIYLLKPGLNALVKKDNRACVPDKATMLNRFGGFTDDTAAILSMANNNDSEVCINNMRFTVQIGAYRFPKNFKYRQPETNKVLTTKLSDGITRFTIGNFYTYKEALAFRNDIRQKGVKDAWITGTCNGKRVVLEKMIPSKTISSN